MSAGVDLLARVIAQGIAEAAREIAREEGRRAALEVLDRSGAAALGREWVSQVEAARVAGVTPQTIREWLRGGALGTPGQRGRVHVGRLREYLARAGQAQATPARARQIAAAALAAVGGGKP